MVVKFEFKYAITFASLLCFGVETVFSSSENKATKKC